MQQLFSESVFHITEPVTVAAVRLSENGDLRHVKARLKLRFILERKSSAVRSILRRFETVTDSAGETKLSSRLVFTSVKIIYSLLSAIMSISP